MDELEFTLEAASPDEGIISNEENAKLAEQAKQHLEQRQQVEANRLQQQQINENETLQRKKKWRTPETKKTGV